ncbi:type III-A CRISPR-associated RAMP protein Csm3 [Tepidiforma flava]|uniref:type III-A CRISPR-associated RAMP protein Csm3 n=1 Tax=Tepidiforma flava TaxID=3004094 RepID=UPI003570B56A
MEGEKRTWPRRPGPPLSTASCTLSCTIRARTGLRIGAQEASLTIGGVDNPVVRDPLTRQPYVPGSSIKGKMRSLLERVHGARAELGYPAGPRPRARVQGRGRLPRLHAVPALRRPGAAERERWLCQTRLRFSDVFMTPESAERLVRANTDLPYTELKSEAAIDRVTVGGSAAHDGARASRHRIRPVRNRAVHL